MPGFLARAIELAGEGSVENVVDQGGFARAGHSSDHGHHSEREGDVKILEIVFARAQDRNYVPVGVTALRAHLDLHLAGNVCASERVGGLHDVVGSAMSD